MTSNTNDGTNRGRIGHTPSRSRRRILRATAGVGLVSAVAGCTGGGGDGSNGDSGGSTKITKAGGISCADLTAGYTNYDGGNRPWLFDFEIPSVLADDAEYGKLSDQVTLRAVQRFGGDDRQFHLFVSQILSGRKNPESFSGDVYELVTEIEFGGETRPVAKISAVDRPAIEQLMMDLPYDAGSGTRYYQVTVQLEVERTPDVSDSCATAIDRAARHSVESIQRNPETSLGGMTETTG